MNHLKPKTSARLFKIPQVSVEVIPYVLAALRTQWTSVDYEFASEFDAKSGDYYVVLKTYFEMSERMLNQIISGGDSEKKSQ